MYLHDEGKINPDSTSAVSLNIIYIFCTPRFYVRVINISLYINVFVGAFVLTGTQSWVMPVTRLWVSKPKRHNILYYRKRGHYGVLRGADIYMLISEYNNNGGWFYEGMAPETELNIKFSGIESLSANPRTTPHHHYPAIDCLNKLNAFNITRITTKYISQREIPKYRCY